MSNVKLLAEKIISLVDEIEINDNYKKKFIKNILNLKKKYQEKKISKERYFILVNKLLKGKSEKEIISGYDRIISGMFKEIEYSNRAIRDSFKEKELEIPLPKKVKKLDVRGVDIGAVKKIIAKSKIKKKEKMETDYTVYSSNFYGKISNLFMERITLYAVKKFPRLFNNLYSSLRLSDIKILSKTYISMMFFSSFLTSIVFTLIPLLFLKGNFFVVLIQSLIIGLFAFIVSFMIIYWYPSILVNSRKRKIKNDLPFVIIHMAAVAGSGAQPISMFNLILSSEEYKGIKGEIKKIVNYVNLFGYDLSTALKAVANTTPSKDFRELLNGIVATIESGGSLKEYLEAKQSDAMLNYKLERKKYVESLSTYSDVYTGVLIAAPLLFFTTLAIIQVLGGSIAGFSVRTLATFGTYAVIPFLNIMFILFINIIQPEV